MGSTGKKIIIGIVLLACIGFVVVPRIIKSNDKEAGEAETAAGNAGPTALPIEIHVIQDEELDNNLRATGSLQANESVTLKAEVAGIVENIYFKEGQTVKSGQLLVQIKDDEIKAEIDKLQHTKNLNESVESRQKQLLAKEAISQEEYEMALTTLNTIIADINLRQVQLDKRKIRAPFSGIIGLRSVSEGSYLTPSETVATLYSINPIKINFSVPGKYAAEVNEGDKIKFTVDGMTEVFEGQIYAVEPQIDPQTRSLQIRATSENKNNRLLPGQFAKIELTLETFEKTIMIPTQAVIPELENMKVFLYKNGKAQAKNIQTGIRTASEIQVVSGLSPGDTLITTGTLQLSTGMDVRVNQ